MSSGNDTINAILKKSVFHRSIKAIKKKIKIKSEFSFIFRDHKRNYKWVCVHEALKTGSFPNSLKCVNVISVCKKWTLFIRRIIDQWVFYHFYERVIYEQTSNYFKIFSMKFCVDSEKHIVRSMLYLDY